MGIDVTISSAQFHPTVPESVSFYSAWKGKEFCYCLFMFSAPPNGELYFVIRNYNSLKALSVSNENGTLKTNLIVSHAENKDADQPHMQLSNSLV